MSKFRVCIEANGYVERYVEAEDRVAAVSKALASIDWDDVDLSCDECYEVKDEPRRRYKIKKGWR